MLLKRRYTVCQWGTDRGLGGGVKPPPNSEGHPKTYQTQPRFWKLLKIAEFRTPTPQDVRKKGSKILKLPSVRNFLTLTVTNKLVVIINSLKVPKIKKMLLYEMKLLVSNYSCLQNPWLVRYCPQIPVLSVLNSNCWTPPPNKIPGYVPLHCVLFNPGLHTVAQVTSFLYGSHWCHPFCSAHTHHSVTNVSIYLDNTSVVVGLTLISLTHSNISLYLHIVVSSLITKNVDCFGKQVLYNAQ